MEILESGKAYQKMTEIIKAQNGKITKPEQIRIGKYSYDVVSGKKGVVKDIDNISISKIARISGAPVDKYLADQILPFMALTPNSKIKVSKVTNHTKTNIYVVEKFLDVKFELDGDIIKTLSSKMPS